jgi:hypothetical protein
LVRSSDHGGFTAVVLTDHMNINDRAIRKLMADGHLETVTSINPMNRRPTVVVQEKNSE